jgi:hypothetical protein
MHSIVATGMLCDATANNQYAIFPIDSETRTWAPRRISHGCIAAALYATEKKDSKNQRRDGWIGIVHAIGRDRDVFSA